MAPTPPNSHGLTSLAKSGSTPLTGAVTLSEGTNISLTESGQDIAIAAALSTASKKALAGYEYDYVAVTAPVVISANSEGTAATIVGGNAVTYDGSTVILIEWFCPQVQVASGASPIVVCVFDGATPLGQICNDALSSAYGLNTATAAKYGALRVTPSAAAHTYSIKGFGAGGNATYEADVGGSGKLAAMFMRITRAVSA